MTKRSLFFKVFLPLVFFVAAGGVAVYFGLNVPANKSQVDAPEMLAPAPSEGDDVQEEAPLEPKFDWDAYCFRNFEVTPATDEDGEYYVVDRAKMGDLEELTIPETYKGLPIKVVSAQAFENHEETKKLVTNEILTKIESKAFSGCTALVDVTLGIYPKSAASNMFSLCPIETLAIKAGRVGTIFQNFSTIKSITIGDGVTALSDAFKFCTNLESVDVAEGNQQYHSTNNCLIETQNKILLLGTNNSLIPTDGSVTSIAAYAFYNKGISEITIPAGITSIGEKAFNGCSSLTQVVFEEYPETIDPGNTSFVDSGAFSRCPVETLIIYAGVVDNSFCGMSTLTTLILSEGVTSICGGAFSGCRGLTSISIPSSVASIGGAILANCSQLESIEVAAGNTAYHAASNCLIDTENEILISGCKNSVIPTDGSVKSIGASAFSGCSGLASLNIPNCVTSIGNDAFNGCSGLGSVVIAGNVNSIGERAFSDCSVLASISIPSGVTAIQRYAFLRCKALSTLIFPFGVQSVGYGAFQGCSGLTSITFSSSVESIGNYAFSGCSSLTSIAFSTNIESIGNYAFQGCSQLASITIPAKVRSIGSSAFKDCTHLAVVELEKYPTISSGAFSNCEIETVIIHSGNVGNAFKGIKMTTLTLGSGVTSIVAQAFMNCTKLVTINFENGIDWNTVTMSNNIFNDAVNRVFNVHVSDEATGELARTKLNSLSGNKTINIIVDN